MVVARAELASATLLALFPSIYTVLQSLYLVVYQNMPTILLTAFTGSWDLPWDLDPIRAVARWPGSCIRAAAAGPGSWDPKDPVPGANQPNLQHTQQPKVQAWQPPSKKLIFKPFFCIGAAPCPHHGINAATLVGHGPHQARIQGDPIGSGLCGPGSKVGIRGACAQDPSLAHGRAAAPSSPPKIARILQRLYVGAKKL